jgi:hypothetical protein
MMISVVVCILFNLNEKTSFLHCFCAVRLPFVVVRDLGVFPLVLA